jgi:hypothetical protein
MNSLWNFIPLGKQLTPSIELLSGIKLVIVSTQSSYMLITIGPETCASFRIFDAVE